jgi:predicted ATPase
MGNQTMDARIRQIQIKNYKSIADATVELEPFTVLVGLNGSGKSNFIDAISFVQECISESIELAFKNRGGVRSVCRSGPGRPSNIEIKMKLDLGEGNSADYGFEIVTKKDRKFIVKKEECSIRNYPGRETGFKVEGGQFKKEIPGIKPRISENRLALYAASAVDEFRPLYDFLSSMRFYSIVPGRLREPQEADQGDFLKRDGSNAAAVLKRLMEDEEGRLNYHRLCRLLSNVAVEVFKVEYKEAGTKETLQFKQRLRTNATWTFDAWNMSDGTLRVLGIFLAVFQKGYHSLIAVEEPEATIHPALTEVITEILSNAAKERQVMITTHSPELLDYKYIFEDQIKAVTMKEGKTDISSLSVSSRKAIREHLYTPGELLKINELNSDAPRRSAEQVPPAPGLDFLINHKLS